MSPRKKLSCVKIVLLMLFGIVVYNEWLVYILCSWRWPYMQCGDIKEFYKILLVADPQILGEKGESWIARWDSDRYLLKTFSTAVGHVKPDLIIFLGDLMDEGSLADPDEYVRYIDRFSKIFKLNTFPPNMGKRDFAFMFNFDLLNKITALQIVLERAPKVFANKTIFLPGDNDIGGEDEQVTRFKVSRYKKYFDQPDISNLGNIQFIKVDKMQHLYPQLTKDELSKNNGKIRVLISHVPLLGLPSWFSAEAIVSLQPKMIFSAHDHKSVHFAGDLITGERTLVEPLLYNKLSDEWPTTWRFQLFNDIVNEVVVPTCSYRMGTLQMGYGAAVIDKNGETLCYSVLMLPSRFILLALYIFSLVISFLFLFWNAKIRNKRFFFMSNNRLY